MKRRRNKKTQAKRPSPTISTKDNEIKDKQEVSETFGELTVVEQPKIENKFIKDNENESTDKQENHEMAAKKLIELSNSNESSNDEKSSSSMSPSDNLIFTNTSSNNSNDGSTNSSLSKEKSKENYLFIELKLISIDFKCANYKPLEQRFLCIESANSLTSHLQKFIFNKMNIKDSLFEIVLIYNGFEIESKCPLIYLKNRFFKDKDLIILYYAIIERKFKMPSLRKKTTSCSISSTKTIANSNNKSITSIKNTITSNSSEKATTSSSTEMDTD